ncbi:GPI transamidase component PIG-T-like [Liolophura sinensis]|uniref:GPI transamidase component PIG-T-like n=1 Tax=Liolophura sinensis TaxID=3198878 RepID=UPI003158F856
MQTKTAARYFDVFLIFGVAFYAHLISAKDSFTEELYVKPLPHGHVYFQFHFSTKWEADIGSPETFQHYRLFPKSLGELISAYNVQELHLSLTQGLWRYEKWGYPKEDAPPGAELWVWFQNNTQDVDKTWSELNNALSGLFCATLNFMDNKSTTSPRWSFRPTGLATKEYARESGFLRYSALPREIACTENLTPWKKLLPCDSKVGLSTLFNTVKLYDANYHSLSVHIRPVCSDADCTRPGIELTQNLALVFDVPRISSGSASWSLKKLFSSGLTTQCPLSDMSKVYVDVTDMESKESPFQLLPVSDSTDVRSGHTGDVPYAVYDVGLQTRDGRQFNLELMYSSQFGHSTVRPPPLYAHRYITGHGLEKGGVTCHLYNSLPEDLMIVYLETLPWYMRMYYNTLRIETNGTMTVRPKHVHYVPGKDRERLYTLELVLHLQAYSITSVRFQFDRAFLKWTEYPPDANHGFYVNSAVISVKLPTKNLDKSDDPNAGFLRLHTESLLLQLPTPDFSMPYNVICLACTVVAIAFGSLHNLTTRRFQLVDPSKKKGLKEKIKSFLQRVFKQKPKEGSVEVSDTTKESSEDKSGGEKMKKKSKDSLEQEEQLDKKVL